MRRSTLYSASPGPLRPIRNDPPGSKTGPAPRGGAAARAAAKAGPPPSPPPRGALPAGAAPRPPLVLRLSPPLRLALGFLLLLLVLAPSLASLLLKPRSLSQRDINAAVEYALQNRPPEPSPGSVAFEKIKASVVRISQLGAEGAGGEELGVGSGVVFTEGGQILTNDHVIAGAARLGLQFSDGSKSEAIVVGDDPDRDIAVLQALSLPDDLKPATLRSLSGLRVGDRVFAVGFPFGIGPSFSSGVISGFDRAYVTLRGDKTLSGLIQFDAAANPGNSGGPLVDQEGQVVGLVTSILNPTKDRVFIGIAFAVPIESAVAGFALNPF
jgi:S1-C subfamily serine protease